MIEANCLSVTINGATLLHPVSFTLHQQLALIVTGRNGTGKSTLLKVLAGAIQQSTGNVSIAGMQIDSRNATFRKTVASMIGLPPFAPDLTVFEHVLLVATTWFEGWENRRSRAKRVLDELNLTGLSERFPHELSSGQIQLFGLALCLVRPSELLVVDEPEQRLDGENLELIMNALQVRKQNGISLVVATHDTYLKEKLGDEFLHLGTE